MIDYSGLSDEQLLLMVSQNDRAAEEALTERYTRLVRVCARPLFLAGGDSEDLSQEGMLGLLSAVRQFSPNEGTTFRTFAEHCIRMRLRTAIKTANRLKHLPLNDGMSFELLSEDPRSPLATAQEIFRRSTEDLVLARESKVELYQSFAQHLSKLESRVLELYLDGLSYTEIAQKLQKDVKAVDNAVQRIRRKLARNLNLGDISKS